MAKYPAAPAGRGPVLEWYQRSGRDAIWAGVLMSVLAFLFLCLKDWGLEWAKTWWLWVLVILPVGLFYFIGKRNGISAGADWFAVKGGHVDIYKLTDVKVVATSAGLGWDLEMKDKAGTEVAFDLSDIQANQKLWDLVYNGIVYSVQRGGAKTNRHALDKLKLR